MTVSVLERKNGTKRHPERERERSGDKSLILVKLQFLLAAAWPCVYTELSNKAVANAFIPVYK